MKTFSAEISDGRYSLWGVLVLAGQDVSLTICGGEQAHIGAAAIGIARPSLACAEKLSASASVFCVMGHKEDALAKKAANRFAVLCGGVATVCAGMHVENAGPEDIGRLTDNYDRLLDLLEQKLRSLKIWDQN